MLDKELDNLLEQLLGVSLNVITYDDSPQNDEAYKELRDTIRSAYSEESLPILIKNNRTARLLRTTSQDNFRDYASRRKWLNESFNAKIQELESAAVSSPTPSTSGSAIPSILLATEQSAESETGEPTKDSLPDYFHPDIVTRCQGDFDSGDYATCILKAFRYIEVQIRALAGLEKTDIGVGLVSKAMSPKNPKLVFSDVEAEQDAYHAMFRGALGSIKNPLSHHEVEHTERGRTLERLAFASMLLNDLNNAKVVRD